MNGAKLIIEWALEEGFAVDETPMAVPIPRTPPEIETYILIDGIILVLHDNGSVSLEWTNSNPIIISSISDPNFFDLLRIALMAVGIVPRKPQLES